MNSLLKSNIAFVMNTNKDITKFTIHRMDDDMLKYVEYDQLHHDELVTEANLIDACGNTYARLTMLSNFQFSSY